MTQPNPGDFVPLGGRSSMPGVSTPRSGAGDANVGTGSSTASVVQVEQGAWEARAAAASWAAEELRRCRQTAASVLTHNYFGEGCAEGNGVYSALKAALSEGAECWAVQLAIAVSELEGLERAINSAKTSLAAADSRSSRSFAV